MRRWRILQTNHAGGRVLAAAAISTMLLWHAGTGGAAPGTRQMAWTKAWAEHELRLRFDATTVACLPLGPAVVVNGARQFKEFVCGLVLVDGSRYSIRLHPVTRTAWSIESMKRLGGNPAPHGGRRPPTNQPPKKTPTNAQTTAVATATTETAAATTTDTTTDTATQPAAHGGAHSGGKSIAKS
jgi:hypothetical protein